MLAHLDDVIRRLSSFFIIPLVNLLLLSAIVFFCSRDRISLASLIPPIDVGEGFRSFVEFIKTKSGVTQIDQQDLVRLFPGVAGLTNFLASASWITFLFLTFVLFFVVYLVDRTIYVIGWLVPFDYDFDPDFYAAAHARDRRILDLYGLIDSSPAFSKLYGIVKASLTASGSAQEEKDRQDILGQIRVADEWFSYAKGYIALLLVGLFPLSFLYNTAPLRLLLCLLIAFFLAALLTVRYVQSHQRLVEHDIDRFLSIELLARSDDAITIRSLNPNPDVSVLADLKNARMRNLNLVGRLLSKLYLRYEDSGIVYTVRFFLPKNPPERDR